MVLRAKTIDLLRTKELTLKQEKNSLQNYEEIHNRLLQLKSYPRRLILELTNLCNLRCIMCGRDEVAFSPNTLELTCLSKLEQILYFIEEVTLFGWGEPTIHPEFENILKFLNNFPVRKYFVTNGMRLNVLKNAIFENQVDIIAVSLDGANRHTNDRIRRGANFEQIISNISDLVSEKRRSNLKYPYMNFVFTAMKSNITELPRVVELAANIGLQEVKVVYLTVFTKSLINESLWNQKDLVEEVFNETVNMGKHYGIEIKLPHIQGDDPTLFDFHKPCFVGWRDLFLGADGYVRPCQSTAMKFFHYTKYDSFFDMWNSREFTDFRKYVNNQKNMPQECMRCYQSSHTNWNLKKSFIQLEQCFAPEWNDKRSIL